VEKCRLVGPAAARFALRLDMDLDEARALKKAKKLAAEAGEAAVAASESGIGLDGAANKKKKNK
jgi:hypothetical protein